MDPYEVLGVSRDADEETIKKAYRALVKKYHPDRYVNTPMAEVASEKMKQINEAYDMITNKNTNTYHNPYGGYGTYSGYGGYGSYSDNYDYKTVSFETVRRLITVRRFQAAEQMLNSLPKTAEWYYLMGVVYLNRGWYNQGMEYINRAIELDPDNMEYRSAASGFNNNTRNYKNVVFTNTSPMCSICTSLCVSWFCCNNGCYCCC